MIYHVLPGDSLTEEFTKTKIDGEVIVCRDAMIAGPVLADTPFEFWDQRARFILAEYGEDEIIYHERVADELERISDLESDAEVNLWFEYELFCSVNMWFCLSLVAQTGSTAYRVDPVVLSTEERWKGFGQLGVGDLQKCFDSRNIFTDSDLKLGTDLWNAYRTNDHERLLKLSDVNSSCFPYLDEVCRAEIEKQTRPKQILNEIAEEGIIGFDDIFAEFSLRAGVYGFGDLQVERLLQAD